MRISIHMIVNLGKWMPVLVANHAFGVMTESFLTGRRYTKQRTCFMPYNWEMEQLITYYGYRSARLLAVFFALVLSSATLARPATIDHVADCPQHGNHPIHRHDFVDDYIWACSACGYQEIMAGYRL